MTQRFQGIGMTSRRTRERMIKRLQERGIKSHAVLAAMRDIPRHIFVDEALASRAYEDTALPIGYNQTISKPYIVAKMSELLFANGELNNILEIGTGCGYQTALLAQFAVHVYTVERILQLQKKAKKHLWDLHLRNISYLHSDGGRGWPENAPYDGILVAAAPPEVPRNLLQQLAVGGVMIIPIARQDGQELQKIVRTPGGYEFEVLEPVSFVPFLSGRS